MDRTVANILTALKDERQKLLESLGDFPKKDPFDHGVQTGTYQGLTLALGIIGAVLADQEGADAKL